MSETDLSFLLRVLADGRPHTLNELLQRSFLERGCGITVHSRAAELRTKGHAVRNIRISGAKRGAASAYQLVNPTAEQVFGEGMTYRGAA